MAAMDKESSNTAVFRRAASPTARILNVVSIVLLFVLLFLGRPSSDASHQPGLPIPMLEYSQARLLENLQTALFDIGTPYNADLYVFRTDIASRVSIDYLSSASAHTFAAYSYYGSVGSGRTSPFFHEHRAPMARFPGERGLAPPGRRWPGDRANPFGNGTVEVENALFSSWHVVRDYGEGGEERVEGLAGDVEGLLDATAGVFVDWSEAVSVETGCSLVILCFGLGSAVIALLVDCVGDFAEGKVKFAKRRVWTGVVVPGLTLLSAIFFLVSAALVTSRILSIIGDHRVLSYHLGDYDPSLPGNIWPGNTDQTWITVSTSSRFMAFIWVPPCFQGLAFCLMLAAWMQGRKRVGESMDKSIESDESPVHNRSFKGN